MFSGDGDDSLTASSKDAILDGGRGSNTLTGGSGTDLFVVRQRENGQDTIFNFDTTDEIINLVGFNGLEFSNLILTQQGSDVSVTGLGSNQSILIKNKTVGSLTTDHFAFQDTLAAPTAYTTTGGTGTTLPPNTSEVDLEGGWQGISVIFQNGQSTATLSGTVTKVLVPHPIIS